MKLTSAKRGDTIIEVMFAIAIFGLVAIISIAAMNRGINSAETALEAATSREELNAQAEAIRFIYEGENLLWEDITKSAISVEDASKLGLLKLSDYVTETEEIGGVNVTGCAKLYAKAADESTVLKQANAFIINTRQKISTTEPGEAYFSITEDSNATLFRESSLGARILYGKDTDDYDTADNSILSDSGAETTIQAVEGIWAFAVEGPKSKNINNMSDLPMYYDIYVQACWYGPGAGTPTVLDTVMRLTTPGAW